MKQLLITIFSMWGICSAQKSQSVTVKATTDILKVAAKSGQSFKVQVNGKLIYSQGVQMIPTAVEKVLYLKDFKDPLVAMNTAIAEGVYLLIDTMTLSNDCIPEKHQLFAGLKVRGIDGKRGVIITNFRYKADIELFGLRVTDTCHFDNIDFVCGTQTESRGGSCIQTEQGLAKYYIKFTNCRWLGDWRFDIQSSQGDSTSILELNNCQLYAYFNCIQFYAQTGAKTILMDNVSLRSTVSHCYYGGPGVNAYFNKVTILGSGKRGVDFRSDIILPFSSKFQIFKNCGNAPGAVALDAGYGSGTLPPQWHLWGQGTPMVIVDSCNLAAGDWQGNFNISNSNLYNAGNGTAIYDGSASLNNCTGEITATGKMNITNSNIGIIAINGADLQVNNSIVNLGNRFRPDFFKASFTKCNIGEFDLSATNFKIKFDNCNFGNQYKAIRLFGGSKDDIEFIGNSYPIATY